VSYSLRPTNPNLVSALAAQHIVIVTGIFETDLREKYITILNKSKTVVIIEVQEFKKLKMTFASSSNDYSIKSKLFTPFYVFIKLNFFVL